MSEASVTWPEDPLQQLFADRDKRWLLVVGGRLGASSGVPLPVRRTKWSPSISDLVFHWLFRTQSRELFSQVEAAVDEGRPPLGLVADSLDDQVAWLHDVLDGLVPDTPVMRVADLAASGMFGAVLSNAADTLLLDAFDRVGVRWQLVTPEQPTATGDALPVFRAWDDRIFQDTEERRARENTFFVKRIDALLSDVAGILVVGQAPQRTDLMDALVAAKPAMPVVWLEERYDDVDVPILEALPDVHRSTLDRLEDGLDRIAAIRGVAPTAPPDRISLPWWKQAMDADFDVRPILVFVPGAALFSGLFKYIPRLSLRAVVSIGALLVIIVVFLNWRVYRFYWDQMQPVVDHIERAEAFLADEPTVDGAIKAEGELSDALVKYERMTLPKQGMTTIPALVDRLLWHHKQTNFEILRVRDFGVTPLLYLNRYRDHVESDPALRTLGHHPPVRALQSSAALVISGADKDPRGIWYRGEPLASYRIAHTLEDWKSTQRLALLADSALLLHVTMHKEMLADMEQGHLVMEVDFSTEQDGALEANVFAEMARVAGYTGERAPLFRPDGIIEKLSKGECAFYFSHLDGTGVGASLARINNLQARFPTCRSVVGASTRATQIQLAEAAPDYSYVALTDYEWGEALEALRTSTSPDFATDVIEDALLRWSVTDPLILSLLVDYHRFVGTAPRSKGQMVDRLLQTMVARGQYGYAPKSKVLARLAWEVYATDGELDRQRAVNLIADLIFFRDKDLVKSTALLDEIVNDGVLRYRAGFVAFVDDTFLHLCVARHLATLPWEDKLSFLLAEDDEIVAFYAGLHRDVDVLVDALLRDYVAVDAVLRDAKKPEDARHRTHVNPFLPALRKAAWVVDNGEVSSDRVETLEALLFELVEHEREIVANEGELDLSSFSTASVRHWVLDGIERDAVGDHRRMSIAARAPNDIYVGAIERWFRRLTTDADQRKDARYDWSGAMTAEMIRGVVDGFSVLGQVGTDDGLQLLEDIALAESDPRFRPEDWRSWRYHAVASLLRNRHFDRVRPFYPTIAAAPGDWKELIPRLYALDDAETAALLVQILQVEADLKKDERARKAKEYAAFSLAMMDREVAMEALGPYLGSGDPYVYYGALSLGFRGDAQDLETVAGIYRAALALPPKERTKDQKRQLNHAVAYFTTDDAFALFEEGWADEDWRGNASGMVSNLRFYAGPRARQFVLENLLCTDSERRDGYFVNSGLGAMSGPEGREALNRLIQVAHGRPAKRWLEAVCPDAAGVEAGLKKLGTWKPDKLGDLAPALASIHADRDLPRFAAWAIHDDRDVRRAALSALGHYRDPAAAEAVLASLEVHGKTNPFHHLKALQAQKLPENEDALLALLEGPGRPNDIIRALKDTGSTKSLPALWPYQDGPPKDIAGWAIYKISLDHLDELDRDAVLAIVEAP